MVADGVAEGGFHLARGAQGPHRELGDFVVEVDKAFHDHPALIHPAAGFGVIPGGGHFGGAAHQALALAGGGHYGLDHAGVADAGLAVRTVDGGLELIQGIGEAVRGSGQAQFFRRQTADAFPVHGETGGPGRGNHLRQAFRLDLHQHVRGDGLDFRHHQMGLFQFHQTAQGGPVRHVDYMAAMGHLHPGGMVVAVHGDHLDTQALQSDNDFLAQFAGTQQHDAGGGGTQGCTDSHGFSPVWFFRRGTHTGPGRHGPQGPPRRGSPPIPVRRWRKVANFNTPLFPTPHPPSRHERHRPRLRRQPGGAL